MHSIVICRQINTLGNYTINTSKRKKKMNSQVYDTIQIQNGTYKILALWLCYTI